MGMHFKGKMGAYKDGHTLDVKAVKSLAYHYLNHEKEKRKAAPVYRYVPNFDK